MVLAFDRVERVGGGRFAGWARSLLTGGYWYVRNLVATGNPLPTLSIGVGPLKLPSIPFPGASKVSDYLFDSHVWSTYLLPGLRDAFGPAWWAVFVVALVGAALALVLIRKPVVRVVAALSLLSFVAFLVSPQILGLGKMPIYFVVNVCYAAPALILGIAIVPVVAARFGRAGPAALLAVFGLILVATQFDRGLWRNVGTHIAQPTTVSSAWAWGIAVGVAIVVVGLALRFGLERACVPRTVACAARARCLRWSWSVAICSRSRTSRIAINTILRWRGSAIGCWCCTTSGSRSWDSSRSTRCTGPTSPTTCSTSRDRSGDKHSSRIPDCAEWRRAINDGRYDYVVATNPGFPFPRKAPAHRSGLDPIRSRGEVAGQREHQRRGGHGCSRSTASCIPAVVRPHPLPARSGQ